MVESSPPTASTTVAAIVSGASLDLAAIAALDGDAVRAELRAAAVLRGRVEVVRSLDALPATVDALARGRIGIAHAASLARARRAGVFDREPERTLVGYAETMNAEDFARVVDQAIMRHAPTPRPRARRERTILWDRDGMTHLHAVLETEHGAVVRSALHATLETLWRAEHPDRAAERVDRAPHERRLTDALLAICRGALGGDGPATDVTATTDVVAAATGITVTAATTPGRAGAGRPALPTMTVVIDHRTLRGEVTERGTCELLDRTPLDIASALRLACDCDIIPAVLDTRGHVLHYGRTTRRVLTPLRNAVHLRDRHCVFPRCTMPVAWCDAHHVIPWQHGGPTDIDNLAMLCHHHHDLTHRHRWTLTGSPGSWTWTPPQRTSRPQTDRPVDRSLSDPPTAADRSPPAPRPRVDRSRADPPGSP